MNATHIPNPQPSPQPSPQPGPQPGGQQTNRVQKSNVVAKNSHLGHALKSEFRKMASVRGTIIWAILFTGSLYGFMVLQGLFSSQPMNIEWSDLSTGLMVFILLAVVYGASAGASEINNHMQAHSFLTQKSRCQPAVAWPAAGIGIARHGRAATAARPGPRPLARGLDRVILVGAGDPVHDGPHRLSVSRALHCVGPVKKGVAHVPQPRPSG